MSIRTFRVVDPYDTFYEKVCSKFRQQEAVELTVIEEVDSFTSHRSGPAHQQTVSFSLVLMTHDHNGLLVGALVHLETDIYVTIVATKEQISFQVIT